MGAVTRELIAAARELAGTAVAIDPTPQEVSWTVPLDEDEEHATYDPHAVETYFAAATHAALVLAAYRAPYRGRSTPVNAWWGSFDLAVSLFSGAPATPPSDDFIMRNAGDAQQVEVGWWPGDARYPRAAFYAYAHPAPDSFPGAQLEPAAGALGRRARRVRARPRRRRGQPRPARRRARLRPLRLPARLRGVRVGPGAAGQRRRHAAADRLSPTARANRSASLGSRRSRGSAAPVPCSHPSSCPTREQHP